MFGGRLIDLPNLWLAKDLSAEDVKYYNILGHVH
jgi:hypothetical protein